MRLTCARTASRPAFAMGTAGVCRISSITPAVIALFAAAVATMIAIAAAAVAAAAVAAAAVAAAAVAAAA
ncbi:MAG: hypothetical protein KK478_21060, partial [Ensifer alkalisoli]|nr:hypothetical protein [Sinorhizobium alkalisoli]